MGSTERAATTTALSNITAFAVGQETQRASLFPHTGTPKINARRASQDAYAFGAAMTMALGMSTNTTQLAESRVTCRPVAGSVPKASTVTMLTPIPTPSTMPL